MKQRAFSFFILMTFILSGCARLSVRTEYLNHERLASYHVNTPDPRLAAPLIGQQLLIDWSLPKFYLGYPDLHLKLTTRFKNQKEEVVSVKITKPMGLYVYSLVKDDYREAGGILTYKVEVIGDRRVLEKWVHPLWADLIVFEIPPDSGSDS